MTGNTADKTHDITVTGRKRMTLTGVEDVVSCDDRRVELKTALGGLVVTGSGMRLGRLDTASGSAELEGLIKAVEYAGSGAEKGFFKKLFR